mmetsp:Transcript_64399/g.149808  ORF Transcript_64399/g.149808 Transcript_64399/m.149808 type:complete len:82 (-) Transcript_64399:128-373(-)
MLPICGGHAGSEEGRQRLATGPKVFQQLRSRLSRKEDAGVASESLWRSSRPSSAHWAGSSCGPKHWLCWQQCSVQGTFMML